MSRDGESAFHRCSILCCVAVSFVSNKPYSLQSLSWSLADPIYIVVTERESRTFAGESQRPSRLPQGPTRLHQLHLTSDTCGQEKFISSGHTHTHIESPDLSAVLRVKASEQVPSSAQTSWCSLWVNCSSECKLQRPRGSSCYP